MPFLWPLGDYKNETILCMPSFFHMQNSSIIHSVLEQISIKGSYLDQILPLHGSLSAYQQELKSSTVGTLLLSKMS